MTQQQQATPLTVIMLDPIVHTVERPECGNADCICHAEEAEARRQVAGITSVARNDDGGHTATFRNGSTYRTRRTTFQ